MNTAQATNYLYLYDLPKENTTSASIASVLQQKTGITLSRMPQIRRDLNRPFYSAIMTIPEEDKFAQACKAMRYFELSPGKPSRALPFDNDLLGSNPQKIVDHNIFVRKIAKEVTPSGLEEHFSKYGDIKSLKISLNSDHQSRGYGFVCFQEADSAAKALAAEGNADSNMVIKYQPRDKREFRKIYNNIYAKNFPENFTEQDVRDLFGKFGRIESMKFTVNDKGPYAFICFNSEDKSDREYGPKCAMEAVDKLNGETTVNGIKLTNKLYVKEALKRTDREAERLRETIKYKSSKKRCNLYVKGFPETMTEDELRQLFAKYGEIESLKMHPPQEDAKKLYAFVCFKKPDEASSAKEALTINDKTLTINHYEIKEIRELHNEAARDKHDFQQFRSQHTHSAKWTDLANQEELQFYLKMLLESMPYLMKQQQRGPGGMGGPHQGGNPRYQGGKPGGMNQRGPNPRYGQGNMPNRGGMHNQMQGMQQPMGGVNPAMQMAPQQQQMMNPQQQMLQQQQQQQQMMAQQQTPEQAYLMACSQIINAVVPENPNYKDQVGTVLYEYIQQIVGAKAPKVTGMLIDLPIEDIKHVMQDWSLLNTRIQQAAELLNQQM